MRKNIITIAVIGAFALVGLASCGSKKGDNYKYELKISMPTGVIRTAGDIVALEKGYYITSSSNNSCRHRNL